MSNPNTNTFRTLTNGRLVWLDSKGVATFVQDDDQAEEGPTCSICDGLGHGYPGGGPCPLEVTDYSSEPWWAV